MNPRVARPVLRASTVQVPPTSVLGPRAVILPFAGRSQAPSRPRRGDGPIVLRLVGPASSPGNVVA
jgi:hypothetical protein